MGENRISMVAIMILATAGTIVLCSAVADAATCGSERAAVKLGLDTDAKQVSTQPTDTTIAALVALSRPRVTPQDRRTAVELNLYRVHAVVIAYKLEDDGDLHLVLSDGTLTMIAELPAVRCARGSAWASEIAAARLVAEQRLHPHRKLRSMVNIPVTVTGPAFFDFVHGQVGHAGNGIELHPVVEIVFEGGSV